MGNKLVIKLLIAVLIVVMFSTSTAMAVTVDDMYNSGMNWISAGNATDNVNEGNIKNVSDTIYSILLTIGIIVAVIIAAVLGVKFMMGTVEQQANIKEQLVPFLIGCVIVFGAFTIWKLVINIMQSLNV